MITEVCDMLYRIEVPLPRNPLRSINAYLAMGKDRNLLIDTGMKIDPCRDALKAALAELGADPGKTDIFVTHLHVDHLGLAGELKAPGREVMMGVNDVDFLFTIGSWLNILPMIRQYGFPAYEYADTFTKDPSLAFSNDWWPEFMKVRDGDVIKAGDFAFTLVETPGHTPGHMCLYEPERKFLISGDHILGDISPNITGWDRSRDPLKNYFESLDKVSSLKVDLVLPGHRTPIASLTRRVDELKEFHNARLSEIRSILETETMDAYRLASIMKWDMIYDRWEDLPVPQRWFATGEALSHLRYLVNRGMVSESLRDDIYVFSMKG